MEIVTFPDEDRFYDMEMEAWQEDIDKIFNNSKKYIEIESMDSSDSFRVMEDFVDSLPDSTTKIRLLTVLEGHKSFGNFKHQIENSGDYRELWFAFRRNRNIRMGSKSTYRGTSLIYENKIQVIFFWVQYR